MNAITQDFVRQGINLQRASAQASRRCLAKRVVCRNWSLGHERSPVLTRPSTRMSTRMRSRPHRKTECYGVLPREPRVR